MGEGTEYQATFRRTEVALPALLGAMLFMGLGVWLSFRDGMAKGFEASLWVMGITLAAVLFIFANCYRDHSWTILAGGVRIHERPKVPLTGLRRRATVPFGEIVGLYHVESGFDHVVDLITRNGRRFRLPQALVAGGSGIGRPDPDRDLGQFVAALTTAAQAAGVPLAAPREGLSFWNSWPGLALQLIMLAIALAIALAAGWMVIDGGASTSSGRTGYGAAIAILLPFGAGYLLMKSLKRRRMVLRG
jgi:hypothetical protein